MLFRDSPLVDGPLEADMMTRTVEIVRLVEESQTEE
jgi:hypothetical protein